MPSAKQGTVPTTQRAYTVRLFPACSSDDPDWKCKVAEMQNILWTTHEAVNRGVKVFGDWLLSLRGGLPPVLADSPADQKERRNRRILLALSWLSVEDESGAPTTPGAIVAFGNGCKQQQDNQQERNRKVTSALRVILEANGVQSAEIGDVGRPGTWLDDCAPSLSSAIRPDAVWVNRFVAFSDLCQKIDGLDVRYAAAVTFLFFGPEKEYFALPDVETRTNGGAGSKQAAEESADFRQKARQWVSSNFGTGKKSEAAQIAESLAKLAGHIPDSLIGRQKVELLRHYVKLLGGDSDDSPENALRIAVGWNTGRSSKGRLALRNLPDQLTGDALATLRKKLLEEADEKRKNSSAKTAPKWIELLRKEIQSRTGIPYVVRRNLIGEYSVMLDHAARRVSIAHTWAKRAEAERRRYGAEAEKIREVPIPARDWLDRFSGTRSDATGAASQYRIRPRALPGWEIVVRRWSQRTCRTEEDRIAAAREVQADWDRDDKFGDIQLFEAMATESAKCVWLTGNTPDHKVLEDYVNAAHARARQTEFKVPAYRHPHPLFHPVFCDFGDSRWTIRFAAHERGKARSGRAADRGSADIRGLEMGLWDGSGIVKQEMRWASKRLSHDLAVEDLGSPNAATVTLASRFGRARVPQSQEVRILNVFAEKSWNGRLQVPRDQLNRIGSLLSDNKREAAETLQSRLRWFLTFSPRLQPTGPFLDFASQLAIRPNRKGVYFPNAERNRAADRGAKAKLVLSRLPDLRVISVDLGHRFAAACAVWQVLSASALEKEIAGQAVVSGGTGSASLYLHTCQINRDGKERITIYRRIGADALPDGATHPAPWARLDRQFLVKLQGEERSARKATEEELDAVSRMEAEFGWLRNKRDRPKQVDELMSHAVRIARLALQRHSDQARIAFSMISLYKPMSGGRKYYFSPEGCADGFNDSPEQRHQQQIESFQNALLLWHGLFSSGDWQDQTAEDLWKKYIVTLPGYERLKEDDGESGRKAQRKANFDRLRRPAEALMENKDLRMQLHAAWKQRWESDDKVWRSCLRRLQDWTRPTGRPSKTTRRVGGLSLTRLATLTELRRRVQTSFFNRMRPDGSMDHAGERFGQKTLDAIEQMREQRVKQLASRIVEAALGMGRLKSSATRELKRPKLRVDEPCHAVVIESLRNYRPDDLRTRRENRALMDWSSGKVRNSLEDACQLYGLFLREVSPNYTSRQCSRTGLPGIRCTEVSVDRFRTSPFWRKAVKSAAKRTTQGKGTEEDRFFCDIEEKYGDNSIVEVSPKMLLRVPQKGGDLFVASPAWEQMKPGSDDGKSSGSRRALQADLNAAANIGLRALLDPDFPGSWWYVPCSAKDGKVSWNEVQGSDCFSSPDVQLLNGSEKSARKRDIVNAWHDLSGVPLSLDTSWKNSSAYWNGAQSRALQVLRRFNGIVHPR